MKPNSSNAKVGAGNTAPVRPNSRPRHLWAKLALLIGVLGISCAIGLWTAYHRIGRTPGELMDYAERRLEGHPRVELIAEPVIAGIRHWLDEPSIEDRRKRPFVVPPPPPLNLAKDGGPSVGPRPDNINGRVLRVGPMESIRNIAEAARLARDGDVVEIQAGEYRADVAVWLQKRLTIRGIGGNARLFADGQSAEGKAIWVLRNGDFDIANIDFIGARASDRNGAGIRFENGRLRIRNCLFWGNENGILTAYGENRRNAMLEIDNCEFAYNGNGDGLSHNLYVGAIGALKVRGCHFHHANFGHLLKSRAEHNEIVYNRLTDENGGRASYELEFPNGGVAQVIGNIIQQNRETEHSSMISYGAEKYIWPKNRLYLASNTLVNDHPYGGAFLRVSPGAQRIVSSNNLLIGKGKYHVSNRMESTNDVHAGWEVFRQASRNDYRLAGTGRQLVYQAVSADAGEGINLNPRYEYVHPRQIKMLAGNPIYAGALQTTER